MSLRTVVFAWLLSSLASDALAGRTERISVDSHGNPTPAGLSDASAVSTDGRFVAFDSGAATLVAHDTNGVFDIFLRDRAAGKTTRVSVASSGAPTQSGDSYGPSISGNGRYIAFESDASSLVADDTNGTSDVFVHDRVTGRTTRVSVASDGTQANGDSRRASISANGRYVAFQSDANDLVENDHNNATDVFVHDRKTRRTTRVSVDSNGVEANHESMHPRISGDGRTIVFESRASNLGVTDANDALDVFLHDREAGLTTCLSLAAGAMQTANDHSYGPAISADGRFVAFVTAATDMALGASNDKHEIILVDRETGLYSRETLAMTGLEITDAHCGEPSLSRTGRFLLFSSASAQLVASDGNGSGDVFVKDRKTGTTKRVSVASNGTESANPNAYYPAISANGRVAVFSSNATDLAGSDANGTGDIFLRKLK